MNSFNERLKMLRKKIRYTQLEVAEKLGISDKSLSDYERGRAEPDIKTLVKMAELFNVSLDYLLGKVEISQDITKYTFRSPYKNTKEYKQIISIIDSLNHKQLGFVLGFLIAVVEKEVKEEII